ncbi:MAG: acyltransferase [Chloroflexota bacterium]
MRNLGLDVLRFMAVLLVLGRHMDLTELTGEFAVLRAWYRGGWVGVDLFFVLSGFLVAGLLFKEHRHHGSIDVQRFLIRRGFKIYPAFYIFILTTIIIKVIDNQTIPLTSLFAELFFVQNYVGGLWKHTWSLAVEEHFYLGIALLAYILMKRNAKEPFSVIPMVWVCVALSCFFLRLATMWIIEDFSHKWYALGTHIRIDSLMFGVLIAYLWHYHNLEIRIEKIASIWFILLGIIFLLPAFIFPIELFKLVSVIGVISFYIGSGFLLLAALRLKTSKNRFLQFIGTLGAASYSVYLWHMMINAWGATLFIRLTGLESFWIYLCVYISGSFAVGYMMNKLIEWPTLKLRDRLFPTSLS